MGIQLGIAAYGGEPSQELIGMAKEFLKTLKSKIIDDVVLILGGYWGLMGYITEEAIRLGFKVVHILPEKAEAKKVENAIAIRTGSSPNLRSTILVRSSDVLIVLGGGAGTMMEALMAYREGIPIVAIVGYGADSDKFFKVYDKSFDSRGLSKIVVCNNVLEAVRKILELIKVSRSSST